MEVYGTKPKRFTKEWWSYFWYYYKWHTIGIGLAAAITIYTCVDCVMREKYDLMVGYISEDAYAEDMPDRLGELIGGLVDDADGDGKGEGSVITMFMGEGSDPQYVQAMQTKMYLEPEYSESFVFITSKKYADILAEYDVWEDAETWAGEGFSGGFVPVPSDSVIYDSGVSGELYIAVRSLREKEQKDEFFELQHENGIKFAQFILNQG